MVCAGTGLACDRILPKALPSPMEPMWLGGSTTGSKVSCSIWSRRGVPPTTPRCPWGPCLRIRFRASASHPCPGAGRIRSSGSTFASAFLPGAPAMWWRRGDAKGRSFSRAIPACRRTRRRKPTCRRDCAVWSRWRPAISMCLRCGPTARSWGGATTGTDRPRYRQVCRLPRPSSQVGMSVGSSRARERSGCGDSPRVGCSLRRLTWVRCARPRSEEIMSWLCAQMAGLWLGAATVWVRALCQPTSSRWWRWRRALNSAWL